MNPETIPDTLEGRQARRFLRNVAMGTLEARLFVAGFLDLLDDPDLADGGRPLVRAADRLLDRLGFATGVTDIAAIYNACAECDLGFWLGTYTLVTPEGAIYLLDVYPQSARLLERASGTVWSTEQPLAGGALTFDAPALRGIVRFASPLRSLDGVLPSPTVPTEPTCEAEFERGPLSKGRRMALKGKRRSFTAEGVRAPGDGDPLTTWLGSYQVTDPDGTIHHEPLVIGRAAMDIPTLSWDGKTATDVAYRSNLMRARLGDQRFSLFFELTDVGRKRVLTVWDDHGEDRRAIGSWLGSADTALAPAEVRRVALVEPASAPVTSQRSLTLNCSVSPKPAFTWLPLAVEKNDYAITLVAVSEGLSRLDATWTLSDHGSLPTTLAILDDQGDGTALFQVSPGETQNAGFYSFVVTATFAGNAYAFALRLQVSSTPTMTLTPSDLPDATRGKPYKLIFGTAGGGTTGGASNRIELLNDLAKDKSGRYIKGEMPDGIEWVPNSGSSAPLISGSATKSQSGYSLMFRISPGDGRLQNPVHDFRSLSVIEPEQRLGEVRAHAYFSSISAWVQTLAIFASGAYFIIRHVKNNPEPAATELKGLRTTLDGALNGQGGLVEKLTSSYEKLMDENEDNATKAKDNADKISKALKDQSESLKKVVDALSKSIKNTQAAYDKARKEGGDAALRDIEGRIDTLIRERMEATQREQKTEKDLDRSNKDTDRAKDVAGASGPK